MSPTLFYNCEFCPIYRSWRATDSGETEAGARGRLGEYHEAGCPLQPSARSFGGRLFRTVARLCVFGEVASNSVGAELFTWVVELLVARWAW